MITEKHYKQAVYMKNQDYTCNGIDCQECVFDKNSKSGVDCLDLKNEGLDKYCNIIINNYIKEKIELIEKL